MTQIPALTEIALPPQTSSVSEQPTAPMAQPASILPQPASPPANADVTPLPPAVELKLPFTQTPTLACEISVRKLAAIDILFLGSKFILAEFAGGVLISVALGIFVLLRGRTFWQAVLGAYLICLGMNHVPMLLYAVDIARKESVHVEMADELIDKRKAMSKCRRLSLLLLVPLVVPILAVKQRRTRRKQSGLK